MTTKRVKPAKRCRSVSGFLIGYRCDLDRGHAGPHEALTREWFDERFGKRVKIGEAKVSWEPR